eukprot:gene842-4114_t
MARELLHTQHRVNRESGHTRQTTALDETLQIQLPTPAWERGIVLGKACEKSICGVRRIPQSGAGGRMVCLVRHSKRAMPAWRL